MRFTVHRVFPLPRPLACCAVLLANWCMGFLLREAALLLTPRPARGAPPGTGARPGKILQSAPVQVRGLWSSVVRWQAHDVSWSSRFVTEETVARTVRILGHGQPDRGVSRPSRFVLVETAVRGVRLSRIQTQGSRRLMVVSFRAGRDRGAWCENTRVRSAGPWRLIAVSFRASRDRGAWRENARTKAAPFSASPAPWQAVGHPRLGSVAARPDGAVLPAVPPRRTRSRRDETFPALYGVLPILAWRRLRCVAGAAMACRRSVEVRAAGAGPSNSVMTPRTAKALVTACRHSPGGGARGFPPRSARRFRWSARTWRGRADGRGTASVVGADSSRSKDYDVGLWSPHRPA